MLQPLKTKPHDIWQANSDAYKKSIFTSSKLLIIRQFIKIIRHYRYTF